VALSKHRKEVLGEIHHLEASFLLVEAVAVAAQVALLALADLAVPVVVVHGRLQQEVVEFPEKEIREEIRLGTLVAAEVVEVVV
jgi:exosome complex RNA-binding protein Csl4